jgi:predicted exporter
MMNKTRTLPLAIWLVMLLLCLLVIVQTRFVADMSAFLPKTPNERQQLLVDQLRDGVIARLIMIGIEGGEPAERAKLSREFVVKLRNTQLFVGVQNGDAATQERDRAYFFENRYLLSPGVTASRFTSEGIHSAISNSIDALSGNAGLMYKQLLPQDPTGETMLLLEQFAGESQPRSIDGVWASHDGKRALLLAHTLAAGSDTDALASTLTAIRQSFDKIPHNANIKLVMSGTSVFSVSSRNLIEGEIVRLATASFVLVVALLLLVYRSVTLLALGLLPVVSGALVGIAAVSIGFGQVHGLTLGFGTTLIGEAVDYSIYYFLQRSGTTAPSCFWRTIRIGVFTSIAGFAALLFSGFPGLAQLGLYSISGLIAAALVTRYVLPAVMPQNFVLRDLSNIGIKLDRIIDHASQLRWAIFVLTLVAGSVILLHSGAIWNRQLAALSPISKADQQLDSELRGDMGGTNMRYIAALTAPSGEVALQKAEQAGDVLQELVKSKIIGGFNSPALVLPSIALQHSRQAAIPDAIQAKIRLEKALNGLPIKANRLQGFLTDIAAARSKAPLLREDLNGTSVALLVDSLLVKRKNDYLVLMPLRTTGIAPNGDEIDLAKVRGALGAKGLSKVIVIDLLEESTSIFDSYRQEALLLSGLGCLAIFGLLLVYLKSIPRTLRIAVPLACAVLCVTALNLISGHQLTILHLIGLLLVVAIGSNYALFFDSGALSNNSADRRQTQVSLLVANLSTVGSFGILAFSKVPVLAAIGSTVGPGAFFSLIFAAILTREKTNAHSH